MKWISDFILILFCEKIISLIPIFFNNWTDNDKRLRPSARSCSVFIYIPFHFSIIQKKTAWYGNGTGSPEYYRSNILNCQQESNISQEAHPFSAAKRKGWDRFQESTVTSSSDCTGNFPIMMEQAFGFGWTVYRVRPRRSPGHAAPEKEIVTCGITSEILLIK